MKEMLRLDKYLADMGTGTRSEIKLWIRKGRVTVNGMVCNKPDTKVITGTDEIRFDNEVIGYNRTLYLMLHKPAGVITATEDKRAATVMDLIKDKRKKDLFPVGRLDKDTEGLILLTNDGNLTHQLLSPKKHVDKVYYAKVRGKVTGRDQA